MNNGTVFFLIFFGAVLVVVAVNEALKYRFISDVTMRWRRQGRRIGIAAHRARDFGSESKRRYGASEGSFGALGIADDALVFVRRGAEQELAIPFDAIRWIGTRKIRVKQGKNAHWRAALVLHYTAWDQYYHLILETKQANALGRYIEQHTGLLWYSLDDGREDYGPADAVRLRQSMLGAWQVDVAGAPPDADPRDDRYERALYLAPDLLIFNHTSTIPVTQMRRIDVYLPNLFAHINPFSTDLLRIEYTNGAGEHEVVGFMLHSGPAWADAIKGWARCPVEVHTGRKKK